MTPEEFKARLRQKMTENREAFEGEYKGHAIEIEREKPDYFYIMVTAPCGMFDYDGWWKSDKTEASMLDAIEEALKGSKLIDA